MLTATNPDGDPLALTAHDAARELTLLSRRFAVAFERLAHGATEGPAERRVVAAAASRVVGQHAVALADLVPESVLLADARAAGEADPVGLPTALGAMVGALDLAVVGVAQRGTSIADAAMLRVLAHVRADLAAFERAFATAG